MTVKASPPRGPILVAAALIEDGSARFLITQRRSDAAVEAGLWEFPGGKIEPGETPKACLQREIKEELGIEIEVGEIFDVSSHVYTNGENGLHIILLGYRCTKLRGEIQLLEVADARWVTLNQLRDFDFAKADIPFLNRLWK